jgi:hypothetical protein
MTLDKTIHQGEPWRVAIVRHDATGAEIVMTGFTFLGEVRKSPNDDTVIATFTCTLGESPTTSAPDTAALCELSESNSLGITPRERYVYDVFAVRPDSSKFFLIGGTLTVVAKVTQWV